MMLEVRGTPGPKGSSRALLIRGRAINVPSGSDANRRAIKSWDVSVRTAAAQKLGPITTPRYVAQALKVILVFRLARPGGHWGRRGLKPSAPAVPRGKPDLDKLVRSTLDALIGSVIDDDARIVEVRASKIYAAPGNEGATIMIAPFARRASDTVTEFSAVELAP